MALVLLVARPAPTSWMAWERAVGGDRPNKEHTGQLVATRRAMHPRLVLKGLKGFSL